MTVKNQRMFRPFQRAGDGRSGRRGPRPRSRGAFIAATAGDLFVDDEPQVRS